MDIGHPLRQDLVIISLATKNPSKHGNGNISLLLAGIFSSCCGDLPLRSISTPDRLNTEGSVDDRSMASSVAISQHSLSYP
jgi:hypothetical protein